MRESTWFRVGLLGAAVGLGVATGCNSAEACDGQGGPAAQVSLEDAVSGDPVCAGSVHFVGLDTDETVSCSQDAGANHAWCSADCTYLLYAEPSREYTVEASAPGYAAGSTTVVVSADECDKPVTQRVTLQLQPN